MMASFSIRAKNNRQGALTVVKVMGKRGLRLLGHYRIA